MQTARSHSAGPCCWRRCPSERRWRNAPAGLNQIETIVVLYLENRSFDHLFGNLPDANGLANAGATAIQVDADGKPYDELPDPLDLRKKPRHATKSSRPRCRTRRSG